MLEEFTNLLTKDKEVQAKVLDFDFETKKLIAQIIKSELKSKKLNAQLKNKRAVMSLEDVSIYKKSLNTHSFEKILGENIKAVIKNYNKEEIELSRAAVMEKKVKSYKIGDTVIATVVSADNEALYVEFDEGLVGKIYINQLSAAKMKAPLLDIYRVGDTLKCKITKIKENNFFELSRIKAYKDIPISIKVGDYIKCRVTKKVDDGSGYFVEVIDNPLYSGIINSFFNPHLRVGDEITLKIFEVQEQKKQLRLKSA